jgi:hypothetical protein
MIKRRIWGSVAVKWPAFYHHGAVGILMQGDLTPLDQAKKWAVKLGDLTAL